MEAFLIYLIKSSGVILLFLACYKLFLSRETFYVGNRYFLLSGLVLAVMLPLISYTKTVWVDISSLNVPLLETISPEATEVVPEIEISTILFVFYAIGILFATIRLLVQLLSLRKVFRKSSVVEEGKFKVLESNKPIQPFSFFNFIIHHSESHTEEDIKAILAHEKIHARQRHSIDILVMHLFTVFQWCNPFIYLYKFYLKENLEFIADANTISSAIQKENYQYLLVKSTLAEKYFDFVNPFFNSSVKKRIVMLNKKKSKKRNSIKYASVVPLLIGFVLLFNVETIAKIRMTSPSPITTDQDQQLVDPKVYSISKETSDDEIEALKKEIEKEKGKLTIEKLERNSKGHIIAATVTLKISEFGQVTKKFNRTNGIESIFFGHNDRGGHSFMRNEKDIAKLKNDAKRKISKIDFDKADVYSIHKNTSDKEIQQIKSDIEKTGRAFSYTHKRDSKGVIIDLELEIRIKTGGSGRFKSEPSFERCYFGFFKDTGVFIADDEKSFNQLKERNAKDSKGLGSNLQEIKNDKFNEVVYDKDKTGDFPLGIGLNYKTSSYPYPLYLVNGVETPLRTVSFISPADIENMTVLKDSYSTSIYGEKGKNGVIAIQTKGSLYPYLEGSLYPYLDDWNPSNPLFRFNTNSNSIKTSQPEQNDYLKVPNLTRVGSEETKKIQQDSDEPLIIVDGKKVSKKKFDKIPASEIESISVLKGKAAKKKYGKKAKNGVVEIITKNN